MIHWFGSYLKKRNIFVILEKTLSEKGILNCGVCQGSILGSTLILIYLNNMKIAQTIATFGFTQIIHAYFIATKMSGLLKEI